MNNEKSFVNYIRAGYPIMWIKTHEEYRVLVDYAMQIGKLKTKTVAKFGMATWDVAQGIRPLLIEDGVLAMHPAEKDSAIDPMIPLKWLEEAEDNTIMFLKDYTPFLQKEYQDSTLISREIRNLITKFRAQGKVLVIISPEVKIPVELDKEISVLNYKLPTREDLKTVLKGVCESTGAKYPEEEDAIIDAALGMTSIEAENAFSMSLVESKKWDPKIIQREKSSIVQKTGLLEIIDSNLTLDDIGGLENLKAWLTARKDCFTAAAREFGVQPPKGLLMVGISGCGKSLTAKAVSTVWGRPLLRFDLGRVHGSYVGESEGNLQRCLDIASAVAPCCLWIDEVEKSLSGSKSGHDSHETTKRVMQLLLTWMQEKKEDVIIVMTANSVNSLPPELLRAGRIDAIFWVDLPDSTQRQEIIQIHLKKVGRKPDMFGEKMSELVAATEGFTGAEIEVWIKEAIVKAYANKHKDVEIEDLLGTIKEITPISKLMKGDIDDARKWAEGRGTKMASISHKDPTATESAKPRKIDLNL